MSSFSRPQASHNIRNGFVFALGSHIPNRTGSLRANKSRNAWLKSNNQSINRLSSTRNKKAGAHNTPASFNKPDTPNQGTCFTVDGLTAGDG